MKQSLLCLGMLFACIFGSSGFETAINPPALQVVDVYDWGTVKPPKNGYLETDLIIKNQALSGNLSIIEVKPACGCTSAEPLRKELAPGEETSIHVKLNISSKQAGLIERNVTIRSVHNNDTSSQIVKLSVHINRLISVGPTNFLNIPSTLIGKTSEAFITVSNPGLLPVTISNIKSSEGFSVIVQQALVLEPKEEKKISVAFTPTTLGNVQSVITFTAKTSEDSDEINIPVFGTATN